MRTTCEKREDILFGIWTAGNFSADDQRRQLAHARKRECKIEMELRSIEYDQALLEPLAPGIDARIIRLETLLEMKRAANRRKDLADLAALEKIAPYKK